MSIDDGRAPAPEKELDPHPSEEGGGAISPGAPAAAEEPALPQAGAAADAEPPAAPGRQPKIGDRVLYRVSEADEPNVRHNAAQLLPAVVVATFGREGCANLKLFTDGPVNVWKTSVLRGDGPGCWRFAD